MSNYYGDVQLGDTIEWLFTTVGTDGAPTQLAGSPTATAYTDGGVTQSATGVTLTADFDSVTGLNKIAVVATSGNGFAAGENIEIVLDAGTVGGTSVVGYAVGSFSIENRSNLRPTTVGNNEVDVTATGAVGIDWGNVENPTTAVDLSGTGIQLCDTVTTNTDMVSEPPTAAAIVNEWETQSQTDPTGFHVNVMEVGGTPQTANDNGADINTLMEPLREDFETSTKNFVCQILFTPDADTTLMARVADDMASSPKEMALSTLENAWTYDMQAAFEDVRVPIRSINSDFYPVNIDAGKRHASSFEITFMSGVGHFLMMEDPVTFNRHLEDTIQALMHHTAGG